MREGPILFKGPLIRKILADQKTQTRRLVKPQPQGHTPGTYADLYNKEPNNWAFWLPDNRMTEPRIWHCPYGVVGDRLWVKEAILLQDPDVYEQQGYISVYEADGEPTPCDTWVWKRNRLNSIHCPRGLSRITLEILGVRIERLQEITEGDAVAEGMEHFKKSMPCLANEEPFIGDPGKCAGDYPHRFSFSVSWDEINGDRATWKQNPWVWVITFRRLHDGKLQAAQATG